MQSALKRVAKRYRQEGWRYLLKSLVIRLRDSRTGRRFRIMLLSDEQTLRGVLLDLRHSNVTPDIQLEILNGTYESEEADAIHRFVDGESDVIELGGCLGFTAVYTNQILNNNQAHLVVEPNSEITPTLRRNRELNDCDFEIIEAAYAPDKEIATLSVPKNVWGGSLYQKSDAIQAVNGTSLKCLVDQYDISEFVLIADIEGGEIDLIENEINLLERHCRLMIIEFHDDKSEYEPIASRITNARRTLEDSVFQRIQEKSGVVVFENQSL